MFMRGRPITMFIPSDVDNYDDIRTELPPEKLKLEWVYPFLPRQQILWLHLRKLVYLTSIKMILYQKVNVISIPTSDPFTCFIYFAISNLKFTKINVFE